MVIKTLSIPQDLQDFLDQSPDLSPSKMLQSKIIEVRANRLHIFDEVNRLKKTIIFLNNKIQELQEKIDG